MPPRSASEGTGCASTHVYFGGSGVIGWDGSDRGGPPGRPTPPPAAPFTGRGGWGAVDLLVVVAVEPEEGEVALVDLLALERGGSALERLVHHEDVPDLLRGLHRHGIGQDPEQVVVVVLVSPLEDGDLLFVLASAVRVN